MGGPLAEDPPTKPPPPWMTGPHVKATGVPLAENPYSPTGYKALGGQLSVVSPASAQFWKAVSGPLPATKPAWLDELKVSVGPQTSGQPADVHA